VSKNLCCKILSLKLSNRDAIKEGLIVELSKKNLSNLELLRNNWCTSFTTSYLMRGYYSIYKFPYDIKFEGNHYIK
jgi:hypothetical protein